MSDDNKMAITTVSSNDELDIDKQCVGALFPFGFRIDVDNTGVLQEIYTKRVFKMLRSYLHRVRLGYTFWFA